MKNLITIVISFCALASSLSFALPAAPQNPLSETKQIEQVINSPLYNYVNSTGGDTSILLMIYKKLDLMRHYLIHSAVDLDHLEDVQRRSLDIQKQQLLASKLTNSLLVKLLNANQTVAA